MPLHFKKTALYDKYYVKDAEQAPRRRKLKDRIPGERYLQAYLK
jgi:hypothetical protein